MLDKMQERLVANPEAMRIRQRTVEHPFGTIKRGDEPARSGVQREASGEIMGAGPLIEAQQQESPDFFVFCAGAWISCGKRFLK